ncbi:MAG: S9 family peptidase, partial [Clostridia bacterium]|nr:S9 family peptidase [Deltaproteobacteria bacterium]
MSRCLVFLLIAVGIVACTGSPHKVPRVSESKDDPYSWLEDVTGYRSLAWVREQNEVTKQKLATDPDFERRRAFILSILDSTDKIPFVVQRGEYWYNFWTDAQHPRGLWRRTTRDAYVKANPKWDVLIDVDALNKDENENWVWHGADCLRPPRGKPWQKCLVALSRGGADADTTREFDLTTLEFVKGGFERAEAKGSLSWIDADTVYANTDFGSGSLTTSGYPRIVKEWKRGAPMSAAAVVYEGKETDLAAGAAKDRTEGFERD